MDAVLCDQFVWVLKMAVGGDGQVGSEKNVKKKGKYCKAKLSTKSKMYLDFVFFFLFLLRYNQVEMVLFNSK